MAEIERLQDSPVHELVEKVKKMCHDEDPDCAVFFAFQGKDIFHVETNMLAESLFRIRSYALRAIDKLYAEGE